MVAEDLSLKHLDPAFRRSLKESADKIIAAGPDRTGRLHRLTQLTLAEAYREPNPHKAEIAFALAAEFRRRAASRALQSAALRSDPPGRDQRQPVLVQQRPQVGKAGGG